MQDQIGSGQHAYSSSQRPPRCDAAQDILRRPYRTWPSHRPPYRRPPIPPHRLVSSIYNLPALADHRFFRSHQSHQSSQPFRFTSITPTHPPQCSHLEPSSSVANGYHTTSTSYERRWIPKRPTELVSRPLGGGGPCFSVVTYNVLAQELIQKNPELYTHCPSDLLDWEYRKHNLLRELEESDAEVICLQEVQEEHYSSWYKPQLAYRGYEGLYQKRTGKHLDGCALFYKSSTLEATGVKAVTYQKHCNPLNKDNVALVVKFRWTEFSRGHATPTSDGHTFCVATTHLLFNPKAGEIKLAQVACLLAEVHSVALDGTGDQMCPVVICGDMNSVPGSPLITFLQDGRLDYGRLSAWDIAGYYRNIGSHKRRIPSPLLPPALGIGADCRYCFGSGNLGEVNEDPPGSAGQTGSANRLLPGSSILPHSWNTTPPQTSISYPPLGSSTGGCSSSDSAPQGSISPPGVSTDKGFSSDGPHGVITNGGPQGVISNGAPQGVVTNGGPRGVITHPFTLHSAYGHAPHNHGTATTFHQAAFETVDYIMFMPVCAGNGGRAWGLRLLSRKAIPHHGALKNLGPQPHQLLSSDHLLLQATFQLVC